MTGPLKESSNEVSAVEVKVQIKDLKDVYNKKKIRCTVKGSEYRLQDSKVTVIIQASENITNVSAYTQRCAEAAIRTHDTIGRLLKRCFGSVNKRNKERDTLKHQPRGLRQHLTHAHSAISPGQW